MASSCTSLRRVIAMAVAAFVTVAVGTACSSGSGADGGDPGAQHTVRLALKNAGMIQAYVFLAQQRGLFAQHGVDVEILYNNPPSALVVAGRADLAIDSPSVASLVAMKGKPIHQIATESQDLFVGLIAARDVPTMDALKARGADCTIATQSPGGSGYGFTLHYVAKLGLGCRIAVVPNQSDALNGVLSGAYTAVAKPGGDPAAIAAVSKGAHWLADPSSPADVAAYGLGRHYLTSAVFGSPDYLGEQRDAVVGVLAAIGEAERAGATTSDADIAAALVQLDPFKQSRTQDLATQFAALRPYLHYGPISDSLWRDSLETYREWQVPGLDIADPRLAYAASVDNAFVESAAR